MLKPAFTSLDQKFQLYCGDCREVLPHLQGQVDLIFADPPYFLSNGGLSVQSGQIVSVNKGEWDKSQGLEHMHAFNVEWLGLAKEALKPAGSLLISATYHNLFSLGLALQSLGFKLLNLITWHKSNPPPNFSCRSLVHASEQILWARKSPKHAHIFNYKRMKELNGNKQMRDVWTLPAIAPWEKQLGKHPTQKPLSLLSRLILMASHEESLVCDPFSGSGSTGIAANLLGRSFVGIEREFEFIQLAIKRKEDLDMRFGELSKKISKWIA
ncbi:DNA-methyltransferase [Helicobacter ailurogastricus]|uniref:Methyltransferase n=1 Tax=Helicobacter ailurogastricus TaxID=1578720 RepID=A0A0K2Y430_9HELI|nr:site-specific DNA-methyltransferase [Helicobacter ailurogastricus]CRF40509.1 DNA modification methyltransferase [Helicobacter ailurogastricus]CRF42800.1 DNA modification methyltransferase [Helicobacter ailurogastricus]CRF44856.1 DNA modification methyltransferase [Helicobacter ailurogastricus]CRF53077.1 DNA modification methyltransferase [Helicobacter ailurogastricus]BDQ28546.1 methyltransferase [Helicobacter ailurogastricus]